MTDSKQIDDEMERDIERLNLAAPRVTPDQIEALMAGVTYDVHVVPGTTTTLATATAANGFTLATGMTACASPSNFNAELGAKYAIKDAESKAKEMLWQLEGWRLKQQLTEQGNLITAKQSGESPSDNRSFSAALDAVKQGKAIRRSGWNGSGLMVKAQMPDEHSKMTLPYLYIEYPDNAKTTPGARCPWLASQTDIMADDWMIID